MKRLFSAIAFATIVLAAQTAYSQDDSGGGGFFSSIYDYFFSSPSSADADSGNNNDSQVTRDLAAANDNAAPFQGKTYIVINSEKAPSRIIDDAGNPANPPVQEALNVRSCVEIACFVTQLFANGLSVTPTPNDLAPTVAQLRQQMTPQILAAPYTVGGSSQ